MTDMSQNAAATGYLRLPAVKSLTGLGRSTIYRRIAEGRFPSPFDLDGGRVGWRRAEIEDWLQSRPRLKGPRRT